MASPRLLRQEAVEGEGTEGLREQLHPTGGHTECVRVVDHGHHRQTVTLLAQPQLQRHSKHEGFMIALPTFPNQFNPHFSSYSLSNIIPGCREMISSYQINISCEVILSHGMILGHQILRHEMIRGLYSLTSLSKQLFNKVYSPSHCSKHFIH